MSWRSSSASRTRPRSKFCRYRRPPWTIFEERLEVPLPKSSRSSSATEYPRVAASRATPAPVMPPPITTTSKGCSWIAWSASLRVITGSLQEFDHLVGWEPLGRALLLHRGAEVEQADERLAVVHTDRGPALVRAQDLRSAPVGREAAAVARQQDDVGGAGGGVQVLLVLDRVSGERAGADDQGRGAIELGGGLGPGGLLEALQGLRADHPKAPRVGQVVVGRPAREVEDLLELLAVDRLGPVGLVGPPCADRLLDFHSRGG